MRICRRLPLCFDYEVSSYIWQPGTCAVRMRNGTVKHTLYQIIIRVVATRPIFLADLHRSIRLQTRVWPPRQTKLKAADSATKALMSPYIFKRVTTWVGPRTDREGRHSAVSKLPTAVTGMAVCSGSSRDPSPPDLPCLGAYHSRYYNLYPAAQARLLKSALLVGSNVRTPFG